MSNPHSSSTAGDAAEPKTDSAEPNKETQAAQCGSQESGESPPLAKQEKKGTRRARRTHVRSGVRLRAASLAINSSFHLIPCCWAAHSSSSVCLSPLVAANQTFSFSPHASALLVANIVALLLFFSVSIHLSRLHLFHRLRTKSSQRSFFNEKSSAF